MTADCHIDFETRSAVDLRKTGVYVYAEDSTTDVWCAAYAIGDGEVKVWLPPQPCPPEIVQHIATGGSMWAHNAAFERVIWKHILTPRYGWPLPLLMQWQCTMARAYSMALPGALDSAAAALCIGEAKDPVGYRTMLRMAKPRRMENDKPIWWDDPVRVNDLVDYCKQDVVVERMLHGRLKDLRPYEKEVWLLDQKINDRGVLVDRALCQKAEPIIAQALAALNKEIHELSNGMIPSVDSVAKIIAFLKFRGVFLPTESISTDALDELLDRLFQEEDRDIHRILKIRQEAGKASVKKIEALTRGCSRDGRARGLLQYHAASTGRWAGRRFQPQNIKRPTLKPQDALIRAIMTKSVEDIRNIMGPPLEVVADSIRGMLIAAPGANFYAADFANIEGRALAWLAGEDWKLKAFEEFDRDEGPDLYKLAYSRSFGIPAEKVDADQRQVGKVMELALGYQGGVGAFQTMARVYGIQVSDDRANELKVAWREAHPKTVQFWEDLEDTAKEAVRDPKNAKVCGKLQFKLMGSFLYMLLPSGRMLTYPFPKLKQITTPWKTEKLALTYKSTINPSNAKRKVLGENTNSTNWARISTYGGSLVENATQAVARDVMAEAMLRVEAAGYPVVLTVHDEVVSEAANGVLSEFQFLMETSPAWADGFPIAAQAWMGPRYKKE